MTDLHLLVPQGIDDLSRPSGGNVYDRMACRGLVGHGWTVREHRAPGDWPRPQPADEAALAAAMAGIPDGALVLIDGIIASVVPDVLHSQATRLRIVVLVHLPRDEPRERLALSAARAVIVTSQWTCGWVGAHYGLPADLLHVVRPGVMPAELAAGTASGRHLLCVGAVTSIKGHDVLLDALAEVAGLEWSCVCAGALDVETGFVSRLLRRRHDAGLDDRVTFTGPLSGDDLDRVFAQADVLVLASRVETYGMAVTEALARGLPVIAADVGGVAEAMGRAADGELPGVLAAPADSPALAWALRDWLGNAQRRHRLRAAARSRRDTLTPWSQTSRQLSAVLAQVAACPR